MDVSESKGISTFGYRTGQDAAFFVKQLKEFVGLGEIDDTAQWVPLIHNDVKRKTIRRRGAVAITVEILPPGEAEDRPAGAPTERKPYPSVPTLIHVAPAAGPRRAPRTSLALR